MKRPYLPSNCRILDGIVRRKKIEGIKSRDMVPLKRLVIKEKKNKNVVVRVRKKEN
jgi:hypothetical protein